MLFEKDSSGTTRKHIFSGSNRICAVDSTGDKSFYHSDHLGSSNVITDTIGKQKGFTEFTPYGSVFKNTGSYDPKYKFTGKEFDSTTGLYFYGARYYDPQLGIITADTIVQAPYDPQSLNRYSYCRNNPINYIDPTGHKWSWKKFWRKAGDFFSNIGKGIAANPGAFIAGLVVGVFTAWAIAPMISSLRGGQWPLLVQGLHFGKDLS